MTNDTSECGSESTYIVRPYTAATICVVLDPLHMAGSCYLSALKKFTSILHNEYSNYMQVIT